MSDRFSNHHRQCSVDNSRSSATATTLMPVAEQRSAPSLDSLLASCGALRSAFRQDGNAVSSDETNHTEDSNVELDACQTEVMECELTANVLNHTEESQADPWQQESIDSKFAIKAMPADIATFIHSLRQEFRASIEDLKSAQSAAAASQSAVLKTLTEIIFQSSSMHDHSGGGLERKLEELEDRILSRINQVGGLSQVGETKASAVFSSPGSGKSTPVKDNSARSWAEIRDEFILEGEVGAPPAEPGLQKFDPIQEESANEDTAMLDQDCILEVPRAIDPETLNEQELRAVFFEREAFISTLIGRLRHQHQKSNGHLPAEHLRHMAEHLPEDLAEQVLRTLQQLDELARIGELELSLERARLARQVNQLGHSRHLIEHNARQLGLTIAQDGTLSNPQNTTPRTGGSRRWLSKLGFGQ